jgi:DNA-directed RNA polymerase specialized sigma24 family protein
MDIAERNRMVEENIGAASAAVIRFWRYRGSIAQKYLTIEDAKQIAYQNLIKAATLFDKSRGFSFTSYVYKSVHNTLLRVVERGGVIAVLRQHHRDGDDWGDKVKAAYNCRQWDAAPHKDQKCYAVHDLSAKMDAESLLGFLSPERRSMVIDYYGLLGAKQLNYKQIAKKYKVSKQVARNRVQRSLLIMRNRAENNNANGRGVQQACC